MWSPCYRRTQCRLSEINHLWAILHRDRPTGWAKKTNLTLFWLQNACTWAPTGFFPGGHRRRKGSVVGGHHGECGARAYNGGLGAKPPWSWKHFGHWMSNGAGKFSPFPKMHLYFYSRCNGNDMGIYVEIQGGQVTPFLGAPMRLHYFFTFWQTSVSCCSEDVNPPPGKSQKPQFCFRWRHFELSSKWRRWQMIEAKLVQNITALQSAKKVYKTAQLF